MKKKSRRKENLKAFRIKEEKERRRSKKKKTKKKWIVQEKYVNEKQEKE